MMSIQLLLFVIAILLVVIFWELCKINSLLKRTLLAAAPIRGGAPATEKTIPSVSANH